MYNYFITPSHGYLEIDLNKYPNIIEIVSGYSFIDRQSNKLYAEEDCDMQKVMSMLDIKDNQLKEVFDDKEKIKTVFTRLDQLA